MPVAELLDEAAEVRRQLGRNAVSRPCKLAGVGRPAGDVVAAPFSGRQVLWYDATVTHHFWKDHYSTDKHGNQRHRRTQHEKVVARERTERGRLALDDGTGVVEVVLTNARIDGAHVILEQMRQALDARSTLAAPGSAGPAASHTIGYKYVERAVLPGDVLFVAGLLREKPPGDGFEIVPDGTRGAIVSTRTEQEVLTTQRRVALAQSIGAAVLALATVALVVGVTVHAVTGS